MLIVPLSSHKVPSDCFYDLILSFHKYYIKKWIKNNLSPIFYLQHLSSIHCDIVTSHSSAIERRSTNNPIKNWIYAYSWEMKTNIAFVQRSKQNLFILSKRSICISEKCKQIAWTKWSLVQQWQEQNEHKKKIWKTIATGHLLLNIVQAFHKCIPLDYKMKTLSGIQQQIFRHDIYFPLVCLLLSIAKHWQLYLQSTATTLQRDSKSTKQNIAFFFIFHFNFQH